MTKRKTLSKKIRFDIFKRDTFTCQYCGNKPPSVVLEVDHIKPVASGGCNDIDNLITACFDCNRGKRADSLEFTPETLEIKMRVQKEKADQLKAYEKILSTKKGVITRKINKLDSLFNELTGSTWTESFKVSLKTFIEKLPVTDIEEAIEIACSRLNDPDKATKYFCGICWNKIKDTENG